MFAIINCTRLKYTFGIKTFIGFGGKPLWIRVWIGFVINLVPMGDL
jgi:hypothetical protein